MKIKLSDIRSGFQNKFFDIPADSIPNRGTKFKSDNINCTLSANVLHKNKFKLKGKVKAAVLYECVRCLKLFNSKISLPIDISFVDKLKNNDKINDDDDVIEILNSDEEFDIGILLGDIIELDNPIKPLCNNECLGLCTVCGINMNDISCNCKIEKGYGLWEELKKLETKEH